jgi:hypothetical protein
MSIHSGSAPHRRTAVAAVAVVVLSGGALSACGSSNTATDTSHSSHSSASPVAQTTQSKVVALHDALRKLWADHMQYTYNTVDAFFHNQAALQPTLSRLLRNQKELGAAIVPFYGKQAGDKLAALLTTHIQDAVPVLTAAKAGDAAGLKKALDTWYANAKEIADFLTAANPTSWPASATEPMMKEHIAQTTTYSVDLLKGNYAKSIRDYDMAFSHMMDMADTLADGIIAQFPDKV